METSWLNTPYLKKRVLNAPPHKELQAASTAYAQCFTSTFLPQFLEGADVRVEDFCQDEYSDLQEKHTELFGPID